MNIPGLTFISNYITEEEEKELIAAIYSEKWLNDLTRRVQHYGYKYDYKTRSIDYSMFIGPLPNWGMQYAKKIYEDGYIDKEPDQLIINEYMVGQGITSHVDCEPCFGEIIASISLESNCVMDFINFKTKQKIPVLLEQRGLLIIKGEARHEWSHGIVPRKTDKFNDQKFDRDIRVSMTFRNVIIK